MESKKDVRLEDRSVEELERILADLESTERKLAQLAEDHPEIASLANDKGLLGADYQIFQSLSMRQGNLMRMKNIRNIIASKK